MRCQTLFLVPVEQTTHSAVFLLAESYNFEILVTSSIPVEPRQPETVCLLLLPDRAKGCGTGLHGQLIGCRLQVAGIVRQA